MNAFLCAAPGPGPDSENRRDHKPARETPLQRQLQETLRGLPFGAVAALVRQILLQMGYTHVSVRRTKQRGHNQYVLGPGGWDVEATWETGLNSQKLIAQVKHTPGRSAATNRPVQMRFVDELRGAMLRANASHGLLVTTGTFSDQARHAALAARESLTLVDGDALVGLLRAYRVGLRQDVYGEWFLDEELFARLRRLFPPKDREAGERDAREGHAEEEGRDAEEGNPGAGGTARAPHPIQGSALTLTVITTALLRPSAGGEDNRRRPRR